MDIFKIFSSKSSPKEVAKERLQLILIHDRADFSPELLENIKSEIFNVLAKYAEFDTSDIEIKLTHTEENNNSSPALVASIPIKRTKKI
ncbi:cell division topological specificity factor MinE [Clostridium sp. USBA 49]|jgi:cell division topological specificity factor|uniref:cell division topological specificity factor MinE n=1 Tax=Clostridium TaxID=1485 RepID=UPI00099B13FA|nr:MULTISPECIES: cell division topological specificity factor MinE [Clostridium]SKA75327.1 cell division topological specificity factor MinE [Clostridium sp. USBA 49]